LFCFFFCWVRAFIKVAKVSLLSGQEEKKKELKFVGAKLAVKKRKVFVWFFFVFWR